MNIADQIKSRRITAYLTQTKLAELVGVSQGKIGDWERGDQTPTVESIEKLATVLGPFTIGNTMKIKATTSKYTREDGSKETLTYQEGEHTFVRPELKGEAGWRPLTPQMRDVFAWSSSSNAVSDPITGSDTSRYTECRLLSAGDMYFASVWEVR